LSLGTNAVAAINRATILEGRGSQIAHTSLLSRMPSRGPVGKEHKTAHITYKFPCSCGEARVVDSVPRWHTKIRDLSMRSVFIRWHHVQITTRRRSISISRHSIKTPRPSFIDREGSQDANQGGGLSIA